MSWPSQSRDQQDLQKWC